MFVWPLMASIVYFVRLRHTDKQSRNINLGLIEDIFYFPKFVYKYSNMVGNQNTIILQRKEKQQDQRRMALDQASSDKYFDF